MAEKHTRINHPNSSTRRPLTRLAALTAHMAPQHSTRFPEHVVPQAPEDPLFGLMAAYRQDTSDVKVDLGIGAYRDDNAKPWVLPVIKKVESTSYSTFAI